jgi:hypothetical protein
MTDSLTPNYGWTKPTSGADNDTWGTLLNADLDSIDTDLKVVSDATTAAQSTASGAATAATAAAAAAAAAQGSANTANATAGAALTAANAAVPKGGGLMSGELEIGDANFALALRGGNPTIQLTANLVMVYNRSNGRLYFINGAGTPIFSIDYTDGTIRAAGSIIPNTAP